MSDDKQMTLAEGQGQGQGEHPAETGATVQLPEGIEPTLDELFNRDPLQWGDADLEKVILHMRESRRLFQKAQTEAKKSGKSKAKTSAAARKALNKPTTALSLGDLGL